MLPAHVRVQRVARLGNGAAQHAAVARAHRVFVLEMRAQRVRRAVDLAALGTRSGVGRTHAHHVQTAARDCKQEVTTFSLTVKSN